MSTTATYQVSGMTCGHCVQAVTREVSALDGVDTVDVDPASGAVTATRQQPLPTDGVRAAVDEAGYQLVG